MSITYELSIFELVQALRFIRNRQFRFFGSNLPKKGIFVPKQGKRTSSLIQSRSQVHILSEKDNSDFLGQIFPKRAEKILLIVNNPRIPKHFSYREINLLKKIASELSPSVSLPKKIFENSSKVGMIYFNISVAENATEIIKLQ